MNISSKLSSTLEITVQAASSATFAPAESGPSGSVVHWFRWPAPFQVLAGTASWSGLANTDW